MWKRFWNWLMSRGWKSFELHGRKDYIVMNVPLMVVLIRVQEEKGRVIKKSSLFWERERDNKWQRIYINRRNVTYVPLHLEGKYTFLIHYWSFFSSKFGQNNSKPYLYNKWNIWGEYSFACIFSSLLRFNWQLKLYVFNVYSLFWYMYTF